MKTRRKIKSNQLNFAYFFSVSFLSLLAIFLFSANKMFYQPPQQLLVERQKCDVPLAPKNPKAVSGINPGEVLLSWEKVAGADHYSIMYGPKSLDYQWGADNVGDVDHYTVSGLNPGSAYYFIINAVNHCGSSPSVKEVAAYAAKRPEPIVKEKGYQPFPSSFEASPSAWPEPEETKETTESAEEIVLEFSPEPSLEPALLTSPSPDKEKTETSFTGFSQILDFLNAFKWLILVVFLFAFLTWYGSKLIKEEKDTRYNQSGEKIKKPLTELVKPKEEIRSKPVGESQKIIDNKNDNKNEKAKIPPQEKTKEPFPS